MGTKQSVAAKQWVWETTETTDYPSERSAGVILLKLLSNGHVVTAGIDFRLSVHTMFQDSLIRERALPHAINAITELDGNKLLVGAGDVIEVLDSSSKYRTQRRIKLTGFVSDIIPMHPSVPQVRAKVLLCCSNGIVVLDYETLEQLHRIKRTKTSTEVRQLNDYLAVVNEGTWWQVLNFNSMVLHPVVLNRLYSCFVMLSRTLVLASGAVQYLDVLDISKREPIVREFRDFKPNLNCLCKHADFDMEHFPFVFGAHVGRFVYLLNVREDMQVMLSIDLGLLSMSCDIAYRGLRFRSFMGRDGRIYRNMLLVGRDSGTISTFRIERSLQDVKKA